MDLVTFVELFPEKAMAETRTITTRNHAVLPDDEYALVESYCPDPACDCRRVMLNVLPHYRTTRQFLAAISFGFDRDAEMAGPFLDPLNPQSRYAGVLLEMVRTMLESDPAYVARLEAHYRQVKEAAADPAHPIHKKLEEFDRMSESRGEAPAAEKEAEIADMDIWTHEWDQDRAVRRSIETIRRIATDLVQLGDDDPAFYRYVAEQGLTIHEAAYYLNAYEYGGETGLQAIREPDIIPAEVAQRATKTVAKILDDHFQGRVPTRITDEGTAIGVYQIEERSSGEKYLFAICQLRLTLADYHWHLYWKRKFGAWWPYSPPEAGRQYTLRARMQQVLDDEYGCFWG